MDNNQLDQLVEAVLTSRNYKSVCEPFIRNIGAQELARWNNLKEAIKATKNKLHQIGGAYLGGEAHYAVWLNELKTAVQSGNRQRLLQTCTRIMSHHSSTRERLPILDQFYTIILADLPPIHSVIDIACGLHPLAIPWMPLAVPVQYYAYDIYQNMIDFLNEAMTLLSVEGYALARDVIHSCPTQKVDLAFILKAIPCLEQVDKSAGSRLLEAINANYLVVSFPAHSLGGRKKGMVTHYDARFQELVADKRWPIKRFAFPTELVFLIVK
jgi:16S rRNA (guanine(1405)-N(7))-methyltransferase